MSGVELWSEILQWIVFAAMAFMVIGLVYLIGDINRRLGPDQGAMIPNEGLEAGVDAPPIQGVDAHSGQRIRLADYRGRTVVVAFLAPTCGPCARLVPYLNRLIKDRREVPFIIVAADGKGTHYKDLIDKRAVVVSDGGGKLERSYKARFMPLVYVIDPEGKIAMRAVTNNMVEMEDAIDGIGFQQGDAPWVPSPAAQ